MAEYKGCCPFIAPVIADRMWVFPVPAYCHRPNAGIHVPGVEKFVRLCVSGRHDDCPGYQATMESRSPAG
jgi:hypothetical protein